MRPIKKIIDIAALQHNWRVLRGKSAHAQMMAVVKANAYGHDMETVCHALADVAPMFTVSCIEEALQIRALGLKQPVMLLEGIFSPAELALCQQHHFLPVIHNYRQLHWLRDNPQYPIAAWIKMDSGMHRLGFFSSDFDAVKQAAEKISHVNWQGVVSHFACADDEDLTHSQWQYRQLQQLSLPLGWQRCFANSAAILRLPETHHDWVRAGVLLYGMSPFTHGSAADLGLKPVMTLQTEILARRQLSAGESAGYGQHFIAPTNGYLATIAIGYGDGFPRCISSGQVPVSIAGKQYYLVGRIAMDMALVWLNDDNYPDGSVVTIFGADLPVESVARAAQTIPYTLTTMLTSRVPLEVNRG